MKINIKRTDEAFQMEAVNEQGLSMLMDASEDLGGHNTGFRPMQLLLTALGGCTSIDVLLILKKQRQEITDFSVEVDGEREKINDYSLFRNINLHFKISGRVSLEKAERAVSMSLEKYCSVAKTLEPTATITYKISINE
ncbi:MAG: OsmC family protein [Saprospiraceae bacterium]|jgi:putative redox protein|nr:OsmC family protein [Saprospiraceae bacterium]